MPGPAKKPKHVLKMRGSRHAERSGGDLSFPVEAPSCPEFLDDEGKSEWNRLVPVLIEQGVLAKADRAALAILCDAWSDYQHAKLMVQREGDTVIGAKGNPVLSPWVRIRNSAADRLLKVGREFGITPASRGRVFPSSQTEDDAFEDFLNGK